MGGYSHGWYWHECRGWIVWIPVVLLLSFTWKEKDAFVRALESGRSATFVVPCSLCARDGRLRPGLGGGSTRLSGWTNPFEDFMKDLPTPFWDDQNTESSNDKKKSNRDSDSSRRPPMKSISSSDIADDSRRQPYPSSAFEADESSSKDGDEMFLADDELVYEVDAGENFQDDGYEGSYLDDGFVEEEFSPRDKEKEKEKEDALMKIEQEAKSAAAAAAESERRLERRIQLLQLVLQEKSSEALKLQRRLDLLHGTIGEMTMEHRQEIQQNLEMLRQNITTEWQRRFNDSERDWQMERAQLQALLDQQESMTRNWQDQVGRMQVEHNATISHLQALRDTDGQMLLSLEEQMTDERQAQETERNALQELVEQLQSDRLDMEQELEKLNETLRLETAATNEQNANSMVNESAHEANNNDAINLSSPEDKLLQEQVKRVQSRLDFVMAELQQRELTIQQIQGQKQVAVQEGAAAQRQLDTLNVTLQRVEQEHETEQDRLKRKLSKMEGLVQEAQRVVTMLEDERNTLLQERISATERRRNDFQQFQTALQNERSQSQAEVDELQARIKTLQRQVQQGERLSRRLVQQNERLKQDSRSRVRAEEAREDLGDYHLGMSSSPSSRRNYRPRTNRSSAIGVWGWVTSPRRWFRGRGRRLDAASDLDSATQKVTKSTTKPRTTYVDITEDFS